MITVRTGVVTGFKVGTRGPELWITVAFAILKICRPVEVVQAASTKIRKSIRSNSNF